MFDLVISIIIARASLPIFSWSESVFLAFTGFITIGFSELVALLPREIDLSESALTLSVWAKT